LRADAPASPARHTGLRECLDWTYRDLDDGAQAVLRATGAFAGTFDLDALQAVVKDRRRAATGLATLVEYSFVERVATDDGTVRYTSIPPIREFAREQLAASPEHASVVDAHARWYASVASAIRERFDCTDADAAIAEYRRESPNINQAIAALHDAGCYTTSLAVACDAADLAVEVGREGPLNEWFMTVVRAAE